MEQVDDLKLIKKCYGEKMSHLCRSLFPTILETPGLLFKIINTYFIPYRYLSEDLEKSSKVNDFKNFVYDMYHSEKASKVKTNKTPEELMNEAGYNLYECKSEAEIQSFRKYYVSNEALCTFTSNRLETCYVFFAVKKDVESIKRENFKNPRREDLYGTSVISIQFTKDKYHTLSIKNRYNHVVPNPDATFSNNLDNIIEGLTDSFASTYGMIQQNSGSRLEIPGYIRSGDGKYYKYNYEVGNVYYCPNNIVIDNFNAKQYDKEKYIVMDYFLLDLVNKKILTGAPTDSFVELIGDIKKVNVIKEGELKKVSILNVNNEVTEITLDKNNNIIALTNNYVNNVKNCFLYLNTKLKSICMNNLVHAENCFLYKNTDLEEMHLPNLKIIDNSFLSSNIKLKRIDLPSLTRVGYVFISENQNIEDVNLPLLTIVGDEFMFYNNKLVYLDLPSLRMTGNYFLCKNNSIEVINLPNVEKIGNNFLSNNQVLNEINLPKVISIGNNALKSNPNINLKRTKRVK